MPINALCDYVVFVVLGICLCTGYVIKNSLDFIPNKYIPLIMLFIGVIANVAFQHSISAEIVLAGMITGLTSTGMHEAFRNLIENGSNNSKGNNNDNNATNNHNSNNNIDKK
ncbi:phage holin family protein [Anaeromicropila herbilytica]|uniref:Holin n=1 Tax=Anaeromicropila herbilytica TaxID=2785025 RepID=A0A7R7EL62_9FIRM|nr:phage holin family protein [Anaeromicropila herbilytica]BCN30631.1 hypothetical protein bsdtb5_19260 [Anaeromicropila herbilytica]